MDQTYELALKRNGTESVQAPKDEVYGRRSSVRREGCGGQHLVDCHQQVHPARRAIAESQNSDGWMVQVKIDC